MIHERNSNFFPLKEGFNKYELPSRLKIAQLHFCSNGADGVSLQIQETAKQLRAWGIESAIISGDYDTKGDTPGIKIPLLHYDLDPQVIDVRIRVNHQVAIEKGVMPTVYSSQAEKKLLDDIYRQAYQIETELEKYLDQDQINVVHARNILSLPHLHPGAALALYRLAKRRTDIHFVLHHHDLAWEGPGAKRNWSVFSQVEKLLQETMVPDLPNVTHFAINPLTKNALEEKFKVKVQYFPDAFDMTQEVISPISRQQMLDLINDQIDQPTKESYTVTHPRNNSVPKPELNPVKNGINVSENDLLVGMMTRVEINKAIELSVQLVEQLNEIKDYLQGLPLKGGGRFGPDSKIILVLPNGGDCKDYYLEKVAWLAQARGVDLVYVGDKMLEQNLSFYGSYQAMDFITYPSEHEGFGNQAIEAVWAKLLLVVHHYPVFQALIDAIPHHIKLGDNSNLVKSEDIQGLNLMDEEIFAIAAIEVVRALQDPKLANKLEINRKKLAELCDSRVVIEQYLEQYTTYPRLQD